VRATKVSFPKRWLLHTIERPEVGRGRFEVEIAPGTGAGRGGGRLTGYVLFPERHVLMAVGGPGFEFLVGDRNYDEGGTLLEAARQRRRGAEAGAWRIEVSPAAAVEEDEFLVVMLPATRGRPALHRVTRIREGNRVGCEIAGPRRTTRWLFDPEQGLAHLKITQR